VLAGAALELKASVGSAVGKYLLKPLYAGRGFGV